MWHHQLEKQSPGERLCQGGGKEIWGRVGERGWGGEEVGGRCCIIEREANTTMFSI